MRKGGYDRDVYTGLHTESIVNHPLSFGCANAGQRDLSNRPVFEMCYVAFSHEVTELMSTSRHLYCIELLPIDNKVMRLDVKEMLHS